MNQHSWLNGFFNLASATTLIMAFRAIKKRMIKFHIIFIHLSLLFSGLFLISYILYHLSIGHIEYTNKTFQEIYFLILITHVFASIVSLPLIFSTYFLGIFNLKDKHKLLAKKTFSLWLYVSITGFIIVLFQRLLN